jgi:hypothetical protein
MIGLSDYYHNANVRARLIEFLGSESIEQATSVYITPNGHAVPEWYNPKPVNDLWRYFEQGCEIGRSLWDRKSVIAHLDIEYVNFDDPAEPYLGSARAFALQRPIVEAVQEVLLTNGIAPLHLLSGRGHHFVWRIDLDTAAAVMLCRIGRVPDTLHSRYVQPQPPAGESVSTEMGRAFAGLGLVLELVAHRVLSVAQPLSEIPIELTAVEAGPGNHGREIISIDLSEYGDPLYTRSIRLPFSPYLKPHQQRDLLGERALEQIPTMFLIPVHEMDDQQGLLVMRNIDEVVQLARRATVQIPDQSRGMENLIATYLKSDLSQFHDYFYSAEHDPPGRWSATYDRTPLETLPPCARHILKQPNEWLLKPGGIQHVVRTLLAVGWHPRHIGGLIRSKYERNYGWGHHWYLYDAATRADFYARVFSGLLAMEMDTLIDFNCRSTQEKGYCPGGQCQENLVNVRQQLSDKTEFRPSSTREARP